MACLNKKGLRSYEGVYRVGLLDRYGNSIISYPLDDDCVWKANGANFLPSNEDFKYLHVSTSGSAYGKWTMRVDGELHHSSYY